MPVVVKKPCLVDALDGVVIVECGASAATLEPEVAERFGHLLLRHAETAREQQAHGAQGEPPHPPISH
jgi:hypothetical protein